MIHLILGIAVIGFILYLILTYVPMPAPIKTLLLWTVVILVVLYLFSVFGFVDMPIPNYRR